MKMIEHHRDPFWLETIEHARRMRPEDKLTAGGDLFDHECEIALTGIRSRHPGISEADALDILRERLAVEEKLETLLAEILP